MSSYLHGTDISVAEVTNVGPLGFWVLTGENEYFVPELLIAARAMKGALDLIRPHLAAAGIEPGLSANSDVKCKTMRRCLTTRKMYPAPVT